MCRLRPPRRAPRNVSHESVVTREQSSAGANAISNFPEVRLVGTYSTEGIATPAFADINKMDARDLLTSN